MANKCSVQTEDDTLQKLQNCTTLVNVNHTKQDKFLGSLFLCKEEKIEWPMINCLGYMSMMTSDNLVCTW